MVQRPAQTNRVPLPAFAGKRLPRTQRSETERWA
jgi:hypothetical protein